MSLPSSSSKPAQTTIKSFFQPRQPKYAAPPSRQPPLPTGLSYETPLAALPSTPLSQFTPAAAAATAATTATTPPRPSIQIPAEAAIRPLSAPDIPALRRINALLLPVTYPDSFYTAALSTPFSRAITWSDPSAGPGPGPDPSSTTPSDPKLVGGIVARLEPLTATSQALYIQSLALLSPYRAHGLAAAALEALLAAPELASLAVTTVYAHVWTENPDAIAWYAARGFTRDPQVQERYYYKLRPDTAYIVRRDLATPLPPPRTSNNTAVMGNTASSPAPSVTAAAANLPPPPKQAVAAAEAAAADGPPPTRPGPPQSRGQSFQNKRAETEWNDLPSDMASGLLAPPSRTNSGPASEASSRSSSTVRKKKDRSYPAAAFQS